MAVTVTRPALTVAPAAKVNVAAALSVKSPATAGETAAVDTVIVTATLDGCDKVAVTVAMPPFSVTDAGDRTSADDGAASLSSVVTFTSSAELAPS